MVPRMIGLANTNLKPTIKLRAVIFSFAATAGRRRTKLISVRQISAAAVLNAYTGAAWWVRAISAPPAAGPATEESWKLPLLQVTAREKSRRETRCGRNAELAGHRNVRAVPAMNRQE